MVSSSPSWNKVESVTSIKCCTPTAVVTIRSRPAVPNSQPATSCYMPPGHICKLYDKTYGRSVVRWPQQSSDGVTIRVGVEKSFDITVDRGPPEDTPNLWRLLAGQSGLLAKDNLSCNTNSTVTETFMQNDFPTISRIWKPSRSAIASLLGSIARRPSNQILSSLVQMRSSYQQQHHDYVMIHNQNYQIR